LAIDALPDWLQPLFKFARGLWQVRPSDPPETGRLRGDDQALLPAHHHAADGTELPFDGLEPTGHFVVLCGYNMQDRTALVADPLLPNPISNSPIYTVRLNRLICAIMLGILTYDANLLIITPPKKLR